MTGRYELEQYAADNGLGSWLSSFMRCGSTRCPNPEQDARDALAGQIAIQVTQKLNAECKTAAPDRIMTESKNVLNAMNAYSAIQSDYAAVNTVVTQVIARLGSNTQPLPGCTIPAPLPVTTPTPGAPTPGNSIAGIDSNMLALVGIGLGAVGVLLAVTK